MNHLQAGYETNKLAIALFEKILSSYKDENTKLLINETVYDIYNSNVLNSLINQKLMKKLANLNTFNLHLNIQKKGKVRFSFQPLDAPMQ